MFKLLLTTICWISICMIPMSVHATTYTNKDVGFALELTKGLQFQGEEEGLLYFAASNGSGMVIVKNFPGLGMDDVREAMAEGYQDEGVYLSPAGHPFVLALQEGEGQAVEVHGMLDGAQVRGFLGGCVGKNGEGFVILAASPTEKWDAFSVQAKQIIHSITILESDGGPEVQTWIRRLSGMRLAERRTYGDYSGGGTSNEDYYFCSDGTFLDSRSSSDSWDGEGGFGYGQSSQRGSGTWQVKMVDGEVRIIFTYHGGTVQWVTIEEKDDKTLVNGSTYFLVNSDQCE